MVVIQADAAHQELLVDLPHDGAAVAGFVLGHGERHSQSVPAAQAPVNLEGGREGDRERQREREREREREWESPFRPWKRDIWTH